jgi:Alpha/beta hydrolase domain
VRVDTSLIHSVVFLAIMLAAQTTRARVTRIDVSNRSEILHARIWGQSGAFEKIAGRVYFAVDPANPHNHQIVDLDKAPRNAHGEVEFSADVYVLRPKSGGNGTLLLEVPNRGGKALLRAVQDAEESTDPATDKEFGDGFLLNQGFTIAWLGWQWDVRDEAGLMRLYAPVAYESDGKSIRGLVRADWTPAQGKQEWPLAHVILEQIGGKGYPVADPAAPQNVLTRRDCPLCSRTVIPRSAWKFAHENAGKIEDSDRFVRLEDGFEPGKIYELVYVAQDPVVAGLGLAAVRDLVSFLKYDSKAIARVSHAVGIGISQDGRFLRHYLWQDFNADESGRKALDGVLCWVAGAGRGSFNHRFAQPSRDAEPTASFFYPTDVFPFTDTPATDPVKGETAGLLDAVRKSSTLPRIFLVNTSFEYWGRAASLTHTTVDGKKDLTPGDEVRIYFVPGEGHFPAHFPPVVYEMPDLHGQQRGNPNPSIWVWRALITDMDQWIRQGATPPPSAYPRIADHALVPAAEVSFPLISGVRLPISPLTAYRIDFGPQWKSGIISFEPPKVGEEFAVLVPQVDHDGNDRAGIRIPELEVPLATYTGWNLRAPSTGMPRYVIPFVGSYIPLPKTPAERQQTHDSRLSIAERYSSREDYIRLYREAAERLVKQRFLLPEDIPAVLRRGEAEWTYAMQ